MENDAASMLQSMEEDAATAARIHNIVHATGHGVQLTAADALRYNNLANMDALVTYGETLDVPSETHSSVLGLHTDMSTILNHPTFTAPPERVVYFDGTPLEKESDAVVALRTSAFDSMQRGQSVQHYGSSNTYDMRGFDGVAFARKSQREQFLDVKYDPNRVNPEIVNETSKEFSGPRRAPALDESQLPNKVAGANVADGAEYYHSRPEASASSWYDALGGEYFAEAQDRRMEKYMSAINMPYAQRK